MRSLFYMPTRVEKEVRRRTRLVIAAYQYENHPNGETVMTDAEFDAECLKVDVTIKTPRPDLDKWWGSQFQTCTGQWIHSYPEQDRISELYNNFYDT